MTRGELYLVKRPGEVSKRSDPKRPRVFVLVGRQVVIDSRFSTVICAPVYTRHDGLSTQVKLGIAEGLKHESSIHCDELMSIPKSMLTHYLGKLEPAKTDELNNALAVALQLEPISLRG